LLATIVSFANSYGGDLIIGIRDTGGIPGRAEAGVFSRNERT
jgi:predicted HTH transcriptional regulator